MLNNVQHPQLMHIAFRLSKKLYWKFATGNIRTTWSDGHESANLVLLRINVSKVWDWQYSFDMKLRAWIRRPITKKPTYQSDCSKGESVNKIFPNVKRWTISYEKILFMLPKDLTTKGLKKGGTQNWTEIAWWLGGM